MHANIITGCVDLQSKVKAFRHRAKELQDLGCLACFMVSYFATPGTAIKPILLAYFSSLLLLATRPLVAN